MCRRRRRHADTNRKLDTKMTRTETSSHESAVAPETSAAHEPSPTPHPIPLPPGPAKKKKKKKKGGGGGGGPYGERQGRAYRQVASACLGWKAKREEMAGGILHSASAVRPWQVCDKGLSVVLAFFNPSLSLSLFLPSHTASLLLGRDNWRQRGRGRLTSCKAQTSMRDATLQPVTCVVWRGPAFVWHS